MIGLPEIPSVRETQAAYARFQDPAGPPVSECELALWSQWSRFDPRLAEQWVGTVSRNWRELSPVRLNEQLHLHPWPSAAGVLLEQAQLFSVWPDGASRRAFVRWMDCVMSGIAPAPGELYFLGLRSFAGQASRKDAEAALKPYRKWGYLGREILLNKAASLRPDITLAPPSTRHQALSGLLASRTRFTVQDYIDELDGMVSRRQAELDLQRDPRIHASGNTRARIYRAGLGRSRKTPGTGA
jgi:hypothetical protein